MVWFKKYSRTLTGFIALSTQDKLLIAESWLALLKVIVFLRTPLRARCFSQEENIQPSVGRENEILYTKELLQKAASHHIKSISCLEHAVALRNMLRRRGINVKVNIGVKGKGDSFEAHAWLDSLAHPEDPQSNEYSILHPINKDRR